MVRTLWLPPEARSGQRIRFPKEESHHLRHVLRIAPGSRIAILCAGHRLEVELRNEGPELWGDIQDEQPISVPSFRLDLAQSLPKGKKMDTVITMAAQVGIDRLIPFCSSRSEVHLAPADAIRRRSHWQKKAEEEAKLTGAWPLGVAPLVSWTEILALGKDYSLPFFFWENAEQSLDLVIQQRLSPTNALVVIGPEGGFAPEEALYAQKQGFTVVSLGSRIYRSEIAGFVAAVLLLSRFGSLGKSSAQDEGR
ncbi:MAG: RsmE family RNA methyltransferase [bacterium]